MKSIRHTFILTAVLLAFAALLLAGCSDGSEEGTPGLGSGILSSTEDINLRDVSGGGAYYAFDYGDEEFSAQYLYGIWTVFDSYKITNKHDMKIICQALIDEHPVLGKDLESYRTADDMAYEWKQHNLAYMYLPEDNAWRESAANVDFDPEDQGRSFEEIYEDRTGKEFDLEKYIKQEIEEGDVVEDIKKLLH